MNNASFETADRGTHIKIVLVSLIASIVVLIIGIAIHDSPAGTQTAKLQSHGPVIKAGPAVAERNSKSVMR